MPIKKNKISYSLDLEAEFDKQNIKPSQRKALSDVIGGVLLDEMLQYLDKGSSPVAKGQYKKTLSKEYKKIKKKKTGKSIADLQLTDSMLGDLKFTSTKKGVELKITDSEQKKKSYNHNVGDTLPTRQFLPNDANNETFKRPIMKKIKDIIKDASED